MSTHVVGVVAEDFPEMLLGPSQVFRREQQQSHTQPRRIRDRAAQLGAPTQLGGGHRRVDGGLNQALKVGPGSVIGIECLASTKQRTARSVKPCTSKAIPSRPQAAGERGDRTTSALA